MVKLNNISITMGAFYSHLRHNITNIIFTYHLNIMKNNFIIRGDFNIKHNSYDYYANYPRVIVCTIWSTQIILICFQHLNPHIGHHLLEKNLKF